MRLHVRRHTVFDRHASAFWITWLLGSQCMHCMALGRTLCRVHGSTLREVMPPYTQSYSSQVPGVPTCQCFWQHKLSHGMGLRYEQQRAGDTVRVRRQAFCDRLYAWANSGCDVVNSQIAPREVAGLSRISWPSVCAQPKTSRCLKRPLGTTWRFARTSRLGSESRQSNCFRTARTEDYRECVEGIFHQNMHLGSTSQACGVQCLQEFLIAAREACL